MIFPGDQVDPDNYNRLLFQSGTGLLPMQLESPVDDVVSGISLEENTPSPVDALRQLSAAVLERVKVTKRYQLKASPEEDKTVRVLARWNDAAASPALVERTFGRGRVLFWTMTADKSWSDWPIEPSYVLTMRETAKAIARTSLGTHELTAGEVLRCPVSAERRVLSPTIELPGGSEPHPLSVESSDKTSNPASTEPPASLYLAWPETYRAGLYRLNWQESPGGAASALYAANPAAQESDLARIGIDDLKQRWRSVEPEIITAFVTADSSVGVKGLEIWRTLAYWLLSLMALESVFAAWVGRQR
jgi:hypothetical protein